MVNVIEVFQAWEDGLEAYCECAPGHLQSRQVLFQGVHHIVDLEALLGEETEKNMKLQARMDTLEKDLATLQ
ncbi:hypothetical protein CYMTET_44845, partial [Cymbomonas tetramitiformis]